MAGDLQNKFKSEINPGMYLRWYNPKKNTVNHFIFENGKSLPPECVILFTEDQLINILGSDFPPMAIMERIVNVWRWEKEYWAIFDTFEEIWLAFLMKERYKLIWNEVIQDWVKIIK